MSVNRCTEICFRLSEYTVTNFVMVTCILSCENTVLALSCDSRHLFKILFEFLGKKKNVDRKKSYWSWIHLSATVFVRGGPIFVREQLPGTVRICFCQIPPCFPGTVHMDSSVDFFFFFFPKNKAPASFSLPPV